MEFILILLFLVALGCEKNPERDRVCVTKRSTHRYVRRVENSRKHYVKSA